MVSDQDLAPREREEIDRLAERYKREFKAGRNPRIEDYLQGRAGLRQHLLRALLALEVDLRQAAGDRLSPSHYQKRFPNDPDIVAEAHGKVAEATSQELAKTIDRQSGADDEQEGPPPERLGRYVIQRLLGHGGFGVVYLAHDPQLDRLVALKVPRRKRFQSPDQVARFIDEARIAANLKHPSLVVVHDVREHDGLPYIVQEYIEGENLGDWSKANQPSFQQIGRILVSVAEALGYAHQQGLTHCDLKLANVLMDTSGQPHVADFGLAVHESSQALRKGEVFGTPGMMAPEQVRGESHRLDGRTDIWAIGVMMYQLLVGRRPFAAKSRKELYAEILTHDPKPLRQIDRQTPRELERICLKCLAKRRTERYNTTDDLREDLLAWLCGEPTSESPHSATVETADPSDLSSRAKPPVKIIPKGLRSFDAEDADFFLELLPGPRDREGLPESIRFWKNRIEETDPAKTFAVGLIYGPSGCGKSSLVKAGLLPKLGSGVLPIYVEATAADTEARILKQLGRHFPKLRAGNDSVSDAVAELRLSGAGRDRKVLIVLDQFEQWLHAHGGEDAGELIDALRQCDGQRVQCIVMVRDDFWMAATRFMRNLEFRLVEGVNSGSVDLFDQDHARKMLAAFGRAYGRLSHELTADQKTFLDLAVQGLAQDEKVVCVRLSVFADMMKGRPWTPAVLQHVGGTLGIGVSFLEETFSASTAPPEHRFHQRAARAVLTALLPTSGASIKGHMQSYEKLLEASGYLGRADEFAELIRILDSEVRLITATDPDGLDLESESAPDADAGRKCYQLTHDYLVPSLRNWLTRKQRETRSGRAQMRLAELAADWKAKPENRHLPNVLEWLNIRWLTAPKTWSAAQAEMMGRAARLHAAFWGSVFAVLLVAGIALQQYVAHRDRQDEIKTTTAAVDAYQVGTGAAIPLLLKELDSLPGAMVQEELQSRFARATGQQKLSLAYALAQFGQAEIETIVAAIVDRETRPSEVSNIVTALATAKDEAAANLEAASAIAASEQNWESKARLAVVGTHLGDLSIAMEMLKVEPDPVQRTVFIEEFPKWCGDVQALAGILQDAEQADIRSGFSLAIGSIQSVESRTREVWQPVLAGWRVNAADAGTHSAAGWAMRRWGLELPGVEVAERTPGHKGWRHTRLELTMLRIPAGQAAGGKNTIVIDDDFWLSDQEISIALFKRFMKEAETEQRPQRLEGGFKFADSYPVQNVSWYDAVKFCNWLSRQHGLDECYKIAAQNEARGEDPKYAVTVIGDDGFRLPSANEWEYACRAGATTGYSCGDDEAPLRGYAVFGRTKPEACGSMMCNPWGLFDMHGNVGEWCWDAAGSDRVFCGGGWSNNAKICQSSGRLRLNPSERNNVLGFRVAQSASGDRAQP